MVCSNCGSSEVIAIQGENFCINCGQLVPKAPAVVSTEGLPDGVKILPIGRANRKPGRPKAGRLDRPADITHRITAEPTPRPTVQDISPPIESVSSSPKTVEPLPKIVASTSIAYGKILSASVGGRFNHHRAWLAAVPAALLAVVGTVAGLVLASAHPMRLVTATRSAGIGVYGELIIIVVTYYLVRSLSHAAIIFGSARLADHRPLATDRWLEIAADSQGRRLGTDVLAVLALAAAGGLTAALVIIGGHAWPFNEAVQVGTLMVAFAAMLYLLTAIVMTVSLAHVAVTLARVHVWSGLRLGWRLFRRHFELAGVRMVALMVELLVVAAVGIGAGGWLVVAPSALHPLIIIALGVIATIVGGFAGAGTAIWWGNAYRLLVSADHPAGFHRLLSTSAPRAGRRTPQIVVATTLLGLSAMAAAWPWFMR